jgi:DNA-binding MarR family transcriptional regulator
MKATRSSAAEAVISEINQACVLMRTRLISRVMTAIYDEGLRPFGIGSTQFALLVVIGSMEPATRAEVGRHLHQDRSTLTRNLKLILSEGWAEEILNEASGRARPLVLTKAGKDLLRSAAPVWRVAQSQAKALLGKDGMFAVMKMADRIMKPQPKHKT